MAYRSRSREHEINDRFQAWLGTAMMFTASVFAVLIFCDRMEMRLISMPAVWGHQPRSACGPVLRHVFVRRHPAQISTAFR